jgi:hypothetical protein
MVMARWQGTITNATGDVLSGASVEVRSEDTGLLAALYSDRAGTVSAGNPIAADADGFVGFHVASGAYKIEATSGATVRTWRYVAIGLAAEHDGLPNDVVQGATQGDILFRGASDWVTLVAGAAGMLLQTQGPAADPLWASPLRLVLQTFTGSGTYTPTSGMLQALVITTGAGGGGGGADTNGSSMTAGGGGGAGGTVIELFNAAAIGASQTVTIGAAGTAGSNTGGGGGTGGDSTFGALHTAYGGVGGYGSGSAQSNPTLSPGGAGGSAANGDVNIAGGAGAPASLLDVTTLSIYQAAGGNGGASFWGGGGLGGYVSSGAAQAGNAGGSAGAGGGGAANRDQTAGEAGGAGAGGYCLVIELVG